MTMQRNALSGYSDYYLAGQGVFGRRSDRYDLYDFTKLTPMGNKQMFFPDQLQGIKYQGYYDGDLYPLIAVKPSLTNGLVLFKGVRGTGRVVVTVDDSGNPVRTPVTEEWDETGDIPLLNRFRPITDFLVGEIFNEYPVFESDNAARTAFMVEWRDRVCAELIRATRWRSIKGRGVVEAYVDEAGEMNVAAVDPANYLPVRSRRDRDEVIAHILLQSYYSDPEPVARQATPDRAVIHRIGLGYQDKAIWERVYTHLGRRLTGWQMSGVQGIATWGTDISDYSRVESLAREITILNATLDRMTFRNSEPLIQRPAGQKDSFWERNLQGTLVEGPTEGDKEGWKVVDTPKITEYEWQAITQKELQMAVLSGIPLNAFGIDNGVHSAVALEQLHGAAVNNVIIRRHELGVAVPGLFDALGAPPGSTRVNWPKAPLVNSQVSVEQALQELKEGVRTIDEYREMRGLPRLSGGRGDKLISEMGDKNPGVPNSGGQPEVM